MTSDAHVSTSNASLPQQETSHADCTESKNSPFQQKTNVQHTYDPLENLSETQLDTFHRFRSEMEKHSALKAHTKDTLLITKFLIARDWNPDRALQMWLHCEKLMRQYEPRNIPYCQQMRQHASHGKIFVYGRDKGHRPVVIVKSDALFAHAGDHRKFGMSFDKYIESSFKYMLWIVENCSRDQSPDGKVSIVYDRLLHSASIFTVMKYVSLLKRVGHLADMYPEVLHRMYIVRPNRVFSAGWKIFSAFLAPSTANKVLLLDHVQDLQQHITKDQLLKTLGGLGIQTPIPEDAHHDYEKLTRKDDVYQEWKQYQ